MAELTVKLISHTKFPVETLYVIWQASRTDNDNPEFLKPMFMELVNRQRTIGYKDNDGTNEGYGFSHEAMVGCAKEANEIFQRVIYSGLPLSENVWFTFVLDNVSITLREQMVRHRLGVKWGPRIGVDMIPELVDSTWWSQTIRIKDMSGFADKGDYLIPDQVKGDELKASYAEHMKNTQEYYRYLVAKGVPLEDARLVLPLAMQHRISWSLNLMAFIHILGKRTCWLAQHQLWAPLIRGMLQEILKVDQAFQSLLDPPCFKEGKWSGCVYNLENLIAAKGEDLTRPPCSLWWNKESPGHGATPEEHQEILKWQENSENVSRYQDRMASFGNLWQRDPITGERQEGWTAKRSEK